MRCRRFVPRCPPRSPSWSTAGGPPTMLPHTNTSPAMPPHTDPSPQQWHWLQQSVHRAAHPHGADESVDMIPIHYGIFMACILSGYLNAQCVLVLPAQHLYIHMDCQESPHPATRHGPDPGMPALPSPSLPPPLPPSTHNYTPLNYAPLTTSIPPQAQYQFCYDSMLDYLESSDLFQFFTKRFDSGASDIHRKGCNASPRLLVQQPVPAQLPAERGQSGPPHPRPFWPAPPDPAHTDVATGLRLRLTKTPSPAHIPPVSSCITSPPKASALLFAICVE